jgi:peptidyl-prolyl cis-trans isomerase-like 4
MYFSESYPAVQTSVQVDLETQLCPVTCQNFLALCKAYRYNFNAFFNVQKDFIAQTGDPTDTGTGGTSVFHQLPTTSPVYSASPFFPAEIRLPRLKHTAKGTLSMAVAGEGEGRGCGSQFFFTLADNIDFLDGKHAVFGRTVEGLDVLDKMNDVFVDKDSRPMRDIRIRHVVVLDDPFPDLPGLVVPPASPVPTPAQLKSLHIGEDEELDDGLGEEAAEDARRARDARAQALTLEMVGDLPFADVKPPENVLFVCKLNAVTRSEDLELIFSRFGTILSCEVIRDKKTGDSLNYAFIEFEEQEAAERAYAKMDNVLIDDRRIHVRPVASLASPRAHPTCTDRLFPERAEALAGLPQHPPRTRQGSLARWRRRSSGVSSRSIDAARYAGLRHGPWRRPARAAAKAAAQSQPQSQSVPTRRPGSGSAAG